MRMPRIRVGMMKMLEISNHFHNTLKLFDVSPNFPFTQVKQCAINTYKHGIYELPHELRNSLRLRTLGN